MPDRILRQVPSFTIAIIDDFEATDSGIGVLFLEGFD